ncbi:hypothetical protein CA267_008340 [Alteromonas pelagimontana]|uniref:Iron transporter n=1 Tax=Alteromonas pelagimontana TaxID=1858656 RepID=A0A6M4MDW3_9ALTE|nr:hypothetical protein [Alteromonas pelagimontana]QJR80785.1 hypothetical protein CA267_008340 [Alteromonas pelagimontana]
MNSIQAKVQPTYLFTFLRVLLAVVGGYAAATGICLLVELAFVSDPRTEDVLTRLLFFIIYPCLIVWSFAYNANRSAMVSMALLNGALWLALLLFNGAA